ncbi:MAG: hypothetical protein PF904_08360 [Kiritimatiellae bacterium]|jgi:hypothetical protein|nr:hypothetical protein [Kiritimatiellia bacterium]
MGYIKTIGLLLVWPIFYLCAQAPIEYRNLDGVNDPKRWGPSECETSVSTRKAWDQPVVRMHIPVDYHGGEKAYPIGWPRMYLNLKPEEQGWQDYDRLEFQLYTESSRSELPKRPLNFHLYNKQGQKKLISITSATVGKCITFTLNISDIGVAGEITKLGFNINESDYADKDMVDFHIGGFRLARATVAQVTELKPAAPAIFCDNRVLPIEVVVEGPPEKLTHGIPLQLKCDKHIALTKTLPVIRGRQTLYMPLSDAKIEPGKYTLIAFPEEPTLRKEATITITSSPWE